MSFMVMVRRSLRRIRNPYGVDRHDAPKQFIDRVPVSVPRKLTTFPGSKTKLNGGVRDLPVNGDDHAASP